MNKTKLLGLLPASLGLALLSALVLYALANPAFPRGVILLALLCAIPGLFVLLTSLLGVLRSFRETN